MRIVQLVKQLNNTELGKGGTHDTYVLIPNELEVTDIFPEPNVAIEFKDGLTEEKVLVRNTVGREKRLVGLGQYYRAKDLSIGDEIVFERIILDENSEYKVYTKKRNDIFVVQKSKLGFDIQTRERMYLIEEWTEKGYLAVDFLCSGKKRNDAPEETDFYDIKIDGISILDEYSSKDFVVFSVTENKLQISKFYGWKKHTFELEE